MQYKRLGLTGLKISRLVLGCGNFGGIGSPPEFYGMGETDEQAAALMDRAWELGITVFDTADSYGGGRSEAAIGKWLKAKGPRVRDQLVLSSKVGNAVGDGPNDRGLSRRHILRQIDASLGRLGTDHLDLYLIHEPDPGMPLEETLGALDALVRAGKVRYLGASNIEGWRLARALWVSDVRRWARFDWVQSSYSLLDRGVEQEVLPLCADQGIGVTPFSPLAGGWLTGKYRRGEPHPAGSRMTLRPEPYAALVNERTFRGLEALDVAARGRQVSMTALALAWVLSHPQVDAAVVGPRRPPQLDPAIAALDLALSPAERDELARLFP